MSRADNCRTASTARTRPSMRLAYLAVSGAFLTWAAQSRAQDGPEPTVEDEETIVVTATRTPTPADQVASSVTVISGDEIEACGDAMVLDALRQVPALDVARAGWLGGQTSVFIRGAKSEHTLVMIDGIAVFDPTLPGRSFNFGHLTTDEIERIEIIRGPQSTLYGSDAMGGVINIITKRGSGEPGGHVTFEAGPFRTFRESAAVSGGSDAASYSFGVSRTDTRGFSAAAEDLGNTEDDGYTNTTAAARFGLTPSDSFGVDFILRYVDAENDIDDFGGAGGDDVNRFTTSRELLFGAQARVGGDLDRWRQKLTLSVVDNHREDNDDPHAGDPGDNKRDRFDGSSLALDWQNNVRLSEANKLVLGVDGRVEEAATNLIPGERASLVGVYLQDQLNLAGSFFGTLGVRVDQHGDFGSVATYRGTAAYLIPGSGTKLKATLGTGFRAPSLYQLYDPSYGNPDLDPDENLGWDFGVEQRLGDRARLGVTYFSTEYENMIDWAWTGPGDYEGEYKNVDEAESKGVEFAATVRPVDGLTLRASYTYTKAIDKETGDNLLKRARNKAGLSATYAFERASVALRVTHVGEREDYIGWDTGPVDGYTLVDLTAGYDVSSRFRIFARVGNLLDEEYEDVPGYGTPGRSIYVGVKASF